MSKTVAQRTAVKRAKPAIMQAQADARRNTIPSVRHLPLEGIDESVVETVKGMATQLFRDINSIVEVMALAGVPLEFVYESGTVMSAPLCQLVTAMNDLGKRIIDHELAKVKFEEISQS